MHWVGTALLRLFALIMEDLHKLVKEHHYLLLFSTICIIAIYICAPEVCMTVVKAFVDHTYLLLVLVILCCFMLLKQAIDRYYKYKMKQLDKKG